MKKNVFLWDFACGWFDVARMLLVWGGMAMIMDTVMALIMATVPMIMIIVTGILNPITGAIIIGQVMDRDLIIGGEITG